MKFFIRDKDNNDIEIESIDLHLEEGDTLLFKVPKEMTVDAKLRAKELLQESFPNNKIVILNNDIEIGILRSK